MLDSHSVPSFPIVGVVVFLAPPRLSASFRPHFPPKLSPIAMAPKTRVSKEAEKSGKEAEGSKKAAVLAQMRRENACFPPALEVAELTYRYSFLWSVKTKDHDAVEVLPARSPAGADKFAFFAPFLYRGLVPPFSEFFDELMRTFGF